MKYKDRLGISKIACLDVMLADLCVDAMHCFGAGSAAPSCIGNVRDLAILTLTKHPATFLLAPTVSIDPLFACGSYALSFHSLFVALNTGKAIVMETQALKCDGLADNSIPKDNCFLEKHELMGSISMPLHSLMPHCKVTLPLDSTYF